MRYERERCGGLEGVDGLDIIDAGNLAYTSRVAERPGKEASNAASLVGEPVRRGRCGKVPGRGR